MKKSILIILALVLCMVVKVDSALSETTVEHKPIRVLFIGNSFTSQIQGTLRNLIRTSPYSESTIDSVAPDSWTLQQHQYSGNTISKIRSSNWDFVVLQEQSFRPTLPDVRAQFYSAVSNLSEAIKESGAQVVLYMTWGWLNGDTYNPQGSPDYETMQQILIEAYTEAARQVDAVVAPVGVAWQSVRRNNPGLGQQLYKGDGYHPSNKGAFLTSCVFYATLFDTDPTELNFNGSLSAEEAAYLRNKAAEAITPVADFNGDGIVDSADMCTMVDRWGEDYSLCDIGPMPWGDGIVDVEDLKVLAEHLFEEINDPTLAAHWAFDETEGMAVADSTGNNNGYAIGDPVWQPDGGLINGALQLDGIDDYVVTGTPPNPADGPLSVLAWIKGGAPGQVIVSQQGAANWLIADAEGNLMTELKGIERSTGPLQSQAIITDGEWHRIGFVWDGSHRTLYVDSLVAAQDTQKAIETSISGLYIGCGNNMEAETFFSGLIDDVRIYNRIVIP